MYYLRLLLILLCATIIIDSAPTDFNLDSINDFTFRLLDNVAAVHEGNFAISPISVWNLYSLLAEGAAGSTYNELMLQLKLPKDLRATQALHKAVEAVFQPPKDVKLNRKAAMFADCSLEIHQEFCQSALSYNTDIYVVDASNKTKLASDINYFICVATDGNVRNVISEESLENLKLLLVDGMYFKANWTYPFDPLKTKVEDFYDQQGRTIGSVNMMYQKAPHTVSYSRVIEAEIIDMSYGDTEDYSMLILLPAHGSTVKKLLKKLSEKPYLEWMKHSSISEDLPRIDCYVPRFKISSNLDLVQPLKYMGLYEIFDETNCQLPGVSASPLFVSKTVQKVELKVTEEGTKAAVATVVGLEDRILGQRVEVNRPFVYVIVDKKSNLVLFAGIYTEPSLV